MTTAATLPKEAETFLKAVFEFTEQNVEFRACGNDVGGGALPLFSRNMSEVAAFLRRHDIDGKGVYVGVSTRRIGSPTGKRQDCVETPAVWVDIDCRKMGMSKEQAVGAMMGAPLPPSMVIDSGNGVHGYWLLKEPANVAILTDEGRDNEERLVAIMRQLVGVFAGDVKVCELARIMRLPGTHNSKEMAKAANGGKPIACRVITVNSRRYDLFELDDWLAEQRPLLDRPEGEAGERAGPAPIDDIYLRYAKESGARVPIDARKELLAMAYLAEGDASVHQTQLRVSGHMVARGYDDEQIVAALMQATIGASGWKGNNWNWKSEEKKIRGLIAGARRKNYDEKAKAAARDGEARQAASADVRGERVAAEGGAREATAGGVVAQVGGDARAHRGLAAEPVSIDAARAEKARAKHARAKPDVLPSDGGDGVAPDDGPTPSSDIEEVARAVLAFWRGERGLLQVRLGEFWLFERDGGDWLRFDTALSCTLSVDISTMTEKLRKKTTSTFLNNVRRRLSEMADIQMPRDFPGFDRLGWIACSNGSINVLTGEVEDHNPLHYTTIKAPCDLTLVDQPPHTWLTVLNEAFSDRGAEERAAIIGVIQEWVGSALVRGKPKSVSRALLLFGESGTGKTRIANVVVQLMGGVERVARLAVAQLDQQFGMEGLLGKVAWIRDDGIKAGDDLACEQFKNLVTGDAMNIARKNKTDVEHKGELPILLTANNLPRINDPTDAVYDRLILIEMRVKRGGNPGERQSDELDAALTGELAGILRWAIDGWRRLKERGRYDLPACLKGHLREMRQSNNPVQTWIEECVTADPSSRVHRADMLCSLNSWFNDTFTGGARYGRNGFGTRGMNPHLKTLMPHVDVDDKTHGERYVSGVKLNPEGLAAWTRGAFNSDGRVRPFSQAVDNVNRPGAVRFPE